MNKEKDGRYSTEDLLEAGLQLLETESIQQLTIDALCKRLGVTKGSFYHHFRNRAEFLECMLEYWVEVWTFARMKEFGTEGSAQERYNRMINAAINYPMNVEINIRAWAQQDALAQKYLQKVDNLRMEYLRMIFEEVCGDPERARLLSQIDYMLFVGSRMISPPVMGEEGLKVVSLLREELYHIPADG